MSEKDTSKVLNTGTGVGGSGEPCRRGVGATGLGTGLGAVAGLGTGLGHQEAQPNTPVSSTALSTVSLASSYE